jgi:predicted dehydrogenase
MNRKIKFGLIGCGKIAERHAEYINQKAELTGVCDIIPGKAKSLGDKYHASSYASLESLLEHQPEMDILSVCTPNGLHAEHSIKAFRSGKHVLCEKPMALTVKDCEKMIREAENANRRLFIVKQNRFNPPVAALKDLLDKKMLGEIFSFQMNCFWNRNNEYYRESDWKGTKSLDGGILYTQFSHFIDLLHWFFGDVTRVRAQTGNFHHRDIIEFEDTGSAILEFESNILGCINFSINSFKRNMEGSLTVFGEKGTVKIGGQYLNTLEYQMIDNFQVAVPQSSNPANDYGFYQGSMSNHDKVIENVVDVLNHSGRVSVTGMEGLKTVQIIERIYASAEHPGHE